MASWNDEQWSADEDADEFAPDDENLTVPCPECGAEVYEDAPACAVCGHYLTHDTHPFTGKPAWWVILGILGMLAFLGTLMLGF